MTQKWFKVKIFANVSNELKNYSLKELTTRKIEKNLFHGQNCTSILMLNIKDAILFVTKK